MKLLFTASTLSHIRNFHLPYLRHLRSQGHIIHVAAGTGGSLEEAEQVFPLPLEKQILAPKNIGHMHRLGQLLKREQYDMIATHTSLAAFFTRMALPSKNPPKIVNTCHGYLFDEDTSLCKRTLLLWAEKLVAKRTDLLLVMNKQDWALANRHHLATQVAQIPGMGLSLSHFQPMTDAEKREGRRKLGFSDTDVLFSCTAEFSPRKNQQLLIRAMTQLPPHCHLLLLGEGGQLNQCQALANELGLRKRVRFLGHQSKVRDYVALCDLVVSASRYEGLPFQLMEAMSMGLPLVASQVKGHEDLILPDYNGLLFPHDDLSALVACLHQMLELDLVSMGEHSRELVAQYDLDVVLPQVIQQYESVLQTLPPSHEPTQ